MTTETSINDLLALAEMATPGPWAYEPHGDSSQYGVGQLVSPEGDDDALLAGYQESGLGVVVEAVAPEVEGPINAAYIAALSPDRLIPILRLAQEVERLREALRWYEDQARNGRSHAFERDGGDRARAALIPQAQDKGEGR